MIASHDANYVDAPFITRFRKGQYVVSSEFIYSKNDLAHNRT